MNHDDPSPTLIPTDGVISPGRRLPLRLELRNPSDEPLRDATAELTLEVERGVLITWQLTVHEVPAGDTVEDAIAASQPELVLPLNVPAGQGRFRLTLMSRDGAWLNQVELEMVVEA